MCESQSPTCPNNAVAYINGRVFTVDKSRPWASAFIVSPDGTFDAVGGNDGIEKIAHERHLATFDLKNHFIMPGIHDAHTHLLVAGERRLWQCGIDSKSDDHTMAENLKVAASACLWSNISGDWIVGNSYNASNFPDNRPDRSALDDVFPQTPVLIREHSMHKILLNTCGLRTLGIDLQERIDPPGGSYVRRPDGSLTGELVESATTMAWLNLPVAPLHMVKRTLLSSIKTCHRYGITSVQEASANTVYLHALNELERENKLSLDVCPHMVYGNEFIPCERQSSLERLLDDAHAFKSRHVDARFVKFFLDGSPVEPHSTHASLSCDGVPDHARLFFDDEALFLAVHKYDARHMTCKIHASGEGSVRQALDVYARVREVNPSGPRHELAHSNAIHSDDLSRLRELRVTAEMSPAVFHVVDQYPQTGHTLRFEFDRVHQAGGTITIGTDWPVVENPNLFPAMAGVIEKFTIDPVCRQPGKDVDPVGRTAREVGASIILRLLTLGAAEALDRDGLVGSIEPGKKASFIAVDRDLSQGHFEGATVLKTWFEGEIVWDVDEALTV